MNKENKTYSMSIRVSKDELEKLKQADSNRSVFIL